LDGPESLFAVVGERDREEEEEEEEEEEGW